MLATVDASFVPANESLIITESYETSEAIGPARGDRSVKNFDKVKRVDPSAEDTALQDIHFP